MPTTEQASPVERPKPDIKRQKIKKEKHESSGVLHCESKVSEPVSRPSSCDISFVPEIQNMMYGFGDLRRPLVESAQLVEDVVHQQLNSMLIQTTDIASMRGAKVIGPEDILFLFRKDKNKLSRILRYLEVKDLKGNFKSEDADEIGDTAGRSKRLRVCHDFLSAIDQTGELVSLLGNNGMHDEIKLVREMRADQLSRCLDQAQYLEYSEARRASFARKFRSAKFKDWLLKDNLTELKLSGLSLELFHYVAYETVAQIVDLALLVKNDATRSGDQVAQGVAPLTLNPNFPSVHLPSVTCQKSNIGSSPASVTNVSPASPPQGSLSPSSPSSMSGSASGSGISMHSPPGKARPKKKLKTQTDPKAVPTTSYGRIQPSEIKEALHRFWKPSGPFHFFTTLPHKTMGSRLLCC